MPEKATSEKPEEKEPETGKREPAAKAPQKKRWPIVVGVVVVVLVVAGIGGLVWHEQPSFCNAICHAPMDGYLETYEAQSGQEATDKWGNTVSDASGMMASVHREKAQANCLSCHQPVMSEQVNEGLEWVSGNFYTNLTERSLTQLVEARGVNSQKFCLNESCHNMTYDDLAKATSNMTYNPHQTHYDGLECSDCHKAHRASVYYCTKCHSDAESQMPAGWITYAQSQQLEQQYATQE
jgi:Zn finger protein HypA/HybF involved in hydrogenase expression